MEPKEKSPVRCENLSESGSLPLSIPAFEYYKGGFLIKLVRGGFLKEAFVLFYSHVIVILLKCHKDLDERRDSNNLYTHQ